MHWNKTGSFLKQDCWSKAQTVISSSIQENNLAGCYVQHLAFSFLKPLGFFFPVAMLSLKKCFCVKQGDMFLTGDKAEKVVTFLFDSMCSGAFFFNYYIVIFSEVHPCTLFKLPLHMTLPLLRIFCSMFLLQCLT